MRDLHKKPKFEDGEFLEKATKGLFGITPEESLLSVNFATTENPLLNETFEEDAEETEI